MEPDKRRGPTVGLIVVVIVTLVGFTFIDMFLARMESRELGSEARHDYDQGISLLRAGHAAPAIDPLSKAHAIERTNPAYQVALAQAQIESGKLDEAQNLLEDLLQRTPNDGDANLLEARIMVRQNKTDDAMAYYHRAIYGIWHANPDQRRVAARLELAQYLAARGDSTDLLAELLPLEAEAQKDPAILQQVAALYLRASSPTRAESAYRALIRQNPKDAADYTGLGNAQLELGNYHGAETAYQEATRLGGGSEIAQRLQLAQTMAALDPTVRWLSSSEKYRRSLRVLQMARDALNPCALTPDSKQMIADTDKVLAEKIKGPMNNETAEDRLAMAEQLWQTRLASCGPSVTPQEESLRLVMAKLAQ